MGACPSCGRATQAGARFCPACGARLGDPAAPAPRARKLVTVLFSDVSGFTTLAERLDAESLQEVMGRYFSAMRRVLHRHGGTVEKFIGDAVMALFGVPVVHEDDALRAARAALEMRSALATLNEELQARWDVRLSARTGVNTGEVVAGPVGDGEPVTYGDAVNVAQRIQVAAAADEILVGGTTARLLGDAATLAAVAPLRVKGRSEPVEAWRLQELRAGARGTPASAARTGAASARARPLVGRRSELQALREAFDTVVTLRRPRLVTLLGPPGIGKSRLADALLEEAAPPARAAVGRCLSYGEGITYFPLGEIVRALARRADEAAIAELAGGGDEGRRIASRVARLVGLSPGGVGAEEAHFALRRLLEIEARRRPLIVVLDDIHWAEASLLDLLEHVANFAGDCALLVVCLARPELLERRSRWEDLADEHTLLRLGPLSDDESLDLVQRRAGGLVRGRARELVLTAEGNPFFLEQLVAMRADAAAPSGAPPPTIQALLTARIDALPAPERAVIDRAAVEGRTFHYAAVAGLLPADQRAGLDLRLASLQRRELIGPVAADLPGQVGYRFAHVLVRDVAYGLLAKATRAELHERYAHWLDDEAGGGADEVVGYQLQQAYRCHADLRPGAGAERRPLAVAGAARLEAAGRAALERGDVPAGVNLLERAAALLPADEPALRAVLPELGMALVQCGRLSQAEDALTDAAARAAAAADPLAEAHALTARFFAVCQLDSALAGRELDARFEHLQRTFTAAGDERGLARLWRARAFVHWLAGRSAHAEAAWMRGVRHARRAGDQHGANDTLTWLASAACAVPTPVLAPIGRCENIVEQLRADLRSQALAMRPLATLEAMAGRFDRARELVERVATTLADLGAGPTAASCQDEALVALLAGEPAQAETLLRGAYAQLEEMGERALLATIAALLARSVSLQGALDEAWRLAGLAEALAGADDMSAEILSRSVRDQVLADRGDAGQAEQLTAHAVALAARTDWLNDHADALVARADVLRSTGDGAGAGGALAAAIALYEQKGNVVSAERARASATAGAVL